MYVRWRPVKRTTLSVQFMCRRFCYLKFYSPDVIIAYHIYSYHDPDNLREAQYILNHLKTIPSHNQEVTGSVQLWRLDPYILCTPG